MFLNENDLPLCSPRWCDLGPRFFFLSSLYGDILVSKLAIVQYKTRLLVRIEVRLLMEALSKASNARGLLRATRE